MSNKEPEHTPSISVVMSVYNGEKYLSTAIDSILQQTWRDFEFIIIDDASTDSSPDILQEYLSKDERIILLENKVNLGLGSSLQKGIEASRGEYIARMDADDISLPDRFEKQMEYLIKHPDILVIGGEASSIEQNNNVQGSLLPKDPNLMRWNMLLGNGLILIHGSVIFRRLFFERFGSYTDLRAAQDFELWTRTFNSEPLPLANLNEIIYISRDHENSTTRAKSNDQEQNAINIRLNKISEFLGNPVLSNVVIAYRHPGDNYDDIKDCIVMWVQIYRKFSNRFKMSKVTRKHIMNELFYEIDKYSTLGNRNKQKRRKESIWNLVILLPINITLRIIKYKISKLLWNQRLESYLT